MFSKLTTVRIIDGIFELCDASYNNVVKLCKDASKKMKIEKLILSTIEDILPYKPHLTSMYAGFYFAVTKKRIQLNTPSLLIPIEIYENDDVFKYREYTNSLHMELTNSQLLKESIQCDAISITRYLILKKCEFNPEYIHYCWSVEMFETIKEHFDVNIKEKDVLQRILDINYFYRNRIIERVLKSKNKNFSYEDYLFDDYHVLMVKRIINECLIRENYEFVGAICKRLDFYEMHVFYNFSINDIDVLQFIDDGYKKFFEFVIKCNNFIFVRVLNKKEVDEYGRDLCMLLLEGDPKKITDDKLNYAIILIQNKLVDFQRTDANGHTLLDYINRFSNHDNKYAKQLVSLAHAHANHQ